MRFCRTLVPGNIPGFLIPCGLIAVTGLLGDNPRCRRHYTSLPSEAREELKGKDFTRREFEVLQLVSKGLSDKEIGAKLQIATRTAKFHVGRLLAKVGVRSRVDLAVWQEREVIGVHG